MSEIFGRAYAADYDRVYGDKDYAAECDLIERAFQAYSAVPVRSILDLGCGTGNHAVPLAERGYSVIGVDRSPEMLQMGGAKIGQKRLDLTFREGDIRNLGLGRTFDSALMMFAVLGYQMENDDVAAALAAARRHLRVGGLLLLDVWYGPAVLAQRPAVRTRELESPDGRILRTASGRLDVRRHICEVTIRLQRMRGRTLVSETTEVHSMRFFFPRELELFLKSAGFALRNMSPFPVLGGEPDESTWNVFLVAEAIAT